MTSNNVDRGIVATESAEAKQLFCERSSIFHVVLSFLVEICRKILINTSVYVYGTFCIFVFKQPSISDFSAVCLANIFEPGHEKMCLMSYANNKGADQPARIQRRRLASARIRAV